MIQTEFMCNFVYVHFIYICETEVAGNDILLFISYFSLFLLLLREELRDLLCFSLESSLLADFFTGIGVLVLYLGGGPVTNNNNKRCYHGYGISITSHWKIQTKIEILYSS